MAVLELLVVVESLQATLLLPGERVARALARKQEHLVVQAACPVLPVLQVPHLLRADCLDEAEAVAALALLARAVLVARVDVALVVVAVVLHAAHTPLALVA